MADERDEPLDPFEKFELRGAHALRTRLIRLAPPRVRARAPAGETPAEAATAPAVSWFGVQLVDASGRPRAGEKYKVTLTDGRELEGKLDARGIARFDDIPRGKCRIAFPELGRRAASA